MSGRWPSHATGPSWRRLALLTLPLLTLGALLLFRPWQAGQPLLTFTQNRVQVRVTLHRLGGGAFRLETTYTPEEGYHLYGSALPERGIDGVGRPTRFDLLPGGAVLLTPELRERPEPFLQRDSTLSRPIPLYPSGPVTLSRKGRVLPGHSAVLKARFTYMSCQDGGGCTPPVVGREAVLSFP